MVQQREPKAHEDGIGADSTVLDLLHRHPATQAVFSAHDAAAGECICCSALFDTVATVAERYELDLETLLAALRTAAAEEK